MSSASSAWLNTSKVNSTPVWALVVETPRRRLIRAVILFDGASYYLAFSRSVREVAEDLLLASPYIEKTSGGELVKKILSFTFSGRTYTATAYRIVIDDMYRLELFVETLRYLLIVALRESIKVKRLIDTPLRAPPRSTEPQQTASRTSLAGESSSASAPEIIYVVEDVDTETIKKKMGDRLA